MGQISKYFCGRGWSGGYISNAQNLFPVKLDNCKFETFCLDCGDIKAGYNREAFSNLEDKLSQELDLTGIQGSVEFQILVSAKGRGCVLSHTDQSNNPITLKIIDELNKFKKWTPAVSQGKDEELTSINLIFIIKDNKIYGQVDRVDMDAFNKSFDHPTNPEIENKGYKYKNDHLKDYKITVWDANNSNLPNNMLDYITIDKDGLVWITVDSGLVTFNGNEFKHAEQNITEKGKYFGYYSLATDNNNVKWVYGKNNIYSFDNTQWRKYDSAEIGFANAHDIINNPNTGELFFCTDEGLHVLKDGKWNVIDKKNGLPINKVFYAKKDNQNRIWIGTAKGTIMMDQNDKLINFEKSANALKGKIITSSDEDENGNLYFSVMPINSKGKKSDPSEGGLLIRYTNGDFKQFTTKNSGLPVSDPLQVLYDKNEKVLWLVTQNAGLVRFDLKDGWEDYHNENSDIPTSFIPSMALDEDGNLYLATRQGLVKIEKR